MIDGKALGAIAAGGALGAVARYGIAVALPARSGGFPWATFGTNVLGCLLIGLLMALITRGWADRRLVRPFLGVGVLGGFTTFSTYTAEARGLFDSGAVGTALAYLAGTVVAAVLAVELGLLIGRAGT